MSCIKLDGFDWSDSLAGFALGDLDADNLSTTEGRNGGNAFWGQGRNDRICYLDLSSRPLIGGRTYMLSFHLNPEYASGPTSFRRTLQMYNGSGRTLLSQDSANSGTGAQRCMTNNGSTTLLNTFNYYNAMNAGQYSRVTYIFNVQTASAGLIQIYIDGTKITEDTTANWVDSGGDYDITQIRWEASNNIDESGVVYLDDIAIWDDQGDENIAAQDSEPGPFIIETLNVTADGSATDWTPQGGGTHYTEVDEAGAPDGDTSYIAGATDGDTDLFDVDAVGDAQTIYAVEVNAVARKSTGTADSALRGVCKSGATTLTTDSQTLTAESYSLWEFSFPLDPEAATAEWDKTSVDAAEFGIQFEETP